MENLLHSLSDRCAKGRVPGESILQSIYITAAAMLNDRGVRVTSVCVDSRQLCDAVRDGRPVIAGEHGDAHVSVYVDRDDRISVKSVRALVEASPRAILVLVSADGPTAFCRKEIPESDRLQYFSARELVHNITRHRLVPPHRALAEQETKEVLDRYSALPEQLPVLLMNDPVRRYYNFRPGTIVEIRRSGMSQEASLYYRRVAV